MQRFDQLVDVGELRREVPARSRGDPAAERRKLEGLRIVPQRQAVSTELLFERGSERARLNPRGAGLCIDFEHLVHFPEIDRQRSGEAFADIGLDPAAHARPAAVGNCRDPSVVAKVQQRDHVALAGRKRDQVRRISKIAAQRAHQIAIRLSVTVARAFERFGAYERAQRGARLDSGRPQRKPFEPRRFDGFEVVHPEPFWSAASTART